MFKLNEPSDYGKIRNHIFLTSSADIDVICAPLKKLGLSYFSFVRSFPDGSHLRLSNNPAWTEHYYLRGFYNVVLNQVPEKDCSVLWAAIDKYPLFHDAAEHFNIDNGVVIVAPFEKYTERYFFGSERVNTAVNHLYTHNLDILKSFVLYFKDKAKPLIDSSYNDRIIIPKHEIITDIRDLTESTNNDLEEFLCSIKTSKIYIDVDGKDYLITPTEARIMALLKKGYKGKKIAQELGLKPKTIDIYRSNLMDKINIHGISNLIKVANKNCLIDEKTILEK